MQAFLDVKVQPLYGQFRALITWKTAPELASGLFSVFKSPDGINDWQPLSVDQPAAEAFIDPKLVNAGKLIENYYKVVVKKGSDVHESPPIGTFGTVRRDEFGAARIIMDSEFEILRRFTQFLICKLRAFGPPCKRCVDVDTDQAIGTSLCPECFGTQKEGGYFPPVKTFGRVLSTTPTVQMNSQEGTGSTDPVAAKIRMIAYPLLRQNDMLVNLGADRRYLVNDTKPSVFGGKIPVVLTVDAMLLPTTDIRYTFPI